MARNPQAKPFRVLGYTQAQWDAIKLAVTTYLSSNDNIEQIPDPTLRALHASLVDDRTWNQVKAELGM